MIESESVSASVIKSTYARTTCSREVGWTSFCIEVVWQCNLSIVSIKQHPLFVYLSLSPFCLLLLCVCELKRSCYIEGIFGHLEMLHQDQNGKDLKTVGDKGD